LSIRLAILPVVCPFLLRASLPVLPEAVGQRLVPGKRRGCLVQDHDVEPGKFRLAEPKRLPHYPLYAITRRCLTAVFFRYRKTKARRVPIVVAAQHCKEFVAAASGFFEYAIESRRIQ